MQHFIAYFTAVFSLHACTEIPAVAAVALGDYKHEVHGHDCMQ